MAIAHAEAYDYIHSESALKKHTFRKVYNMLLEMQFLMNFHNSELNSLVVFYSKSKRKPIVGVAHHVSFTRPYGLFDVAAVTLANSLTLFPYIDSICDKLDFIGINYYVGR